MDINTKKNAHSLAYRYAIKLLAKRDYSQYKLKLKLVQKGYTQDQIEQTLETLIEKKFLREDYYTEARIKGLMHKGYSPYHIQQRLREEHLDVTIDAIEEVFCEYKTTEDDQIIMLLNKKQINREGDLFKQKIKIQRFLASKGHIGDKVDHHLRQFFQQ